MASKVDLKRQPLGPRPKGKKAKRNTPRFDLRTELYRLTGVDWAQVNGIDVNVAQTVIAEVGVDLHEFPSELNFTGWLGLCPTNETSGGKVLSSRTRHVANRAAVAFRLAASTLVRSQSNLVCKWWNSIDNDSPHLYSALSISQRSGFWRVICLAYD